VLSSLVDQSDAVLMDLRGFSQRNAGCVFEIGELFRLVPLDRVLFIVDRETDAAFLDQTFGRAAALASSESVPGVSQNGTTGSESQLVGYAAIGDLNAEPHAKRSRS
jgi:hypothetical protein